MSNILYISLTGMTEPLGRSQVLEYIIDLSKDNKFYLISFEREQDLENINEIKELIKDYDIEWNYLIYSNKYGVYSTLYQLFQAVKLANKLKNLHNVKMIHARSFIPAIIAYIVKLSDSNVKFLFDVRGFSTKEKIDRGRLKKNSLLYKILFWLENLMFQKADALNTLTYKAKEILEDEFKFDKDYIKVIPTCANKEVFKIISNKEKNKFKKSLGYKDEDIIIIHTGTVSGWYDFDKELILINELMKQDSNVRFLILNKNEKNFIEEKLDEYNMDRKKVKITSSSFSEVYKYLNIASASLFFIKPTEAKRASAPTKFAENVACYLPSISNSGVGDMEFYLEKYNVGWLVELDKIKEHKECYALSILKEINKENFDNSGFDKLFKTHFDKQIAVNKYNSIYEQLGECYE